VQILKKHLFLSTASYFTGPVFPVLRTEFDERLR